LEIKSLTKSDQSYFGRFVRRLLECFEQSKTHIKNADQVGKNTHEQNNNKNEWGANARSV